MVGRASMRGGATLVASLALALGAASPALGEQVTVSATPDTRFAPARVTLAPGDSVVWRNLGGEHNVRFDDGSFEHPTEPSSLSWTTPVRVFPAVGRFTYYCERHGGPNRSGMSGEVVVGAPVREDTTKPQLSKVRLRPKAAKLSFSFVSSEAGDAVVKLQRRRKAGFKRVRTFRRAASKGRTSLTLRGKGGHGLAPGRYRAVVVVRDEAGNRSRSARASARISPPS